MTQPGRHKNILRCLEKEACPIKIFFYFEGMKKNLIITIGAGIILACLLAGCESNSKDKDSSAPPNDKDELNISSAVMLGQHKGIEVGLGLLSGWLGGCVAQSGPPVVFLALARGWEKDAFRANLMAYFLALNVVALLAYWRLDLLTRPGMTLSLAALPSALLAVALGLWIKRRVDETAFRRIVLVVVILVGLAGLLLRG